jgi:hypothetical protein
MHNIVRLALRNSAVARRVALAADDYIYGRRPLPAEVRGWSDMA